MRTRYAEDSRLSVVPTVFMIHNLACQGVFPESVLVSLGRDPALFIVSEVEFWG